MAGQARMLGTLRGRSVALWTGVELALWGPDGSDPQFGDATDPPMPCLHLVGLQAVLTDGATMTVTTYQNDAHFGLRTFPEPRFDDRTWDDIYRWRAFAELPTGEVEQVAAFADADVVTQESVLAEIHLRIGGHPLLLVAGELDGTTVDELLLYRLDDSVLAFTDLDTAEHANWNSPRTNLRPIHPHGRPA